MSDRLTAKREMADYLRLMSNAAKGGKTTFAVVIIGHETGAEVRAWATTAKSERIVNATEPHIEQAMMAITEEL